MTATHTTIHVFVEVTKTDKRKVEFSQDQVTGAQIKTAAQVPLDTDLAQHKQGQLVLVRNDDTITIKNGDQFVVLPAGAVS